jgi:two-component system phosphate regulon sensor histidine kinase PhoR
LRAWRSAGAGPVLTVSVTNGEERLGALTLLRASGRPAWNPVEVRLAESIAADLGRGVHHARLFEREQRLVAQLKELDTAKTDFMSTVSHELRTPLTSIAGYVEMLRDEDGGEVNPTQRRMLDVIHRNTVRLRTLIEDLLILSRIEAGTFRTQRRTVDVATVVSGALTAVAPAAEKASVELRAEVAGPLPVNADANQLDRVVLGLLSNAVKFTPGGGSVTVTGRVADGEVVVEVADTGMGVPAGERQQLFSRFFRASNAMHHAVPGTGLGLAIVRTIVENHDGTIDMTSAENAGTTVTVRLPRAAG